MNSEIRHAMKKIVIIFLCIVAMFSGLGYHFFYYAGDNIILLNVVGYGCISFVIGGYLYEMYLYIERIYLILKLQELEEEKRKRENDNR